jgi:LacI family transcriptional regulator
MVYDHRMPALTTLSPVPSDPAANVPRPTMRDVAALAGVSLKTVSRVVNAEPGVSPELQGRVHRAVAQVGYRPNLTASSLRRTGGKTATVGTILKNVANPFSAAIQRAVEDVARAHNVIVFASSSDEDGDREKGLAASFIAHRVDGLIIVPGASDQSYLARELGAGLAVIFVDRPPRFLDADAVVSANREGAAAGVRHLVEHGHRRIAFLGDQLTIHTAAERLAGYRDALTGSGIPWDDTIVRGGLRSVDEAAAATTELLTADDPPTALFTAQNLITEGGVQALRRLGMQHDIALVGFDDFPMADLLDPAVTVVAQDPARMGELAADLLFRRLSGDMSPSTTAVVPTTLIQRGSGELPLRRTAPDGSRTTLRR